MKIILKNIASALLTLACLIMVFPSEAAAQSRSVSGRVVDENGDGVISAAVTNKSTRETVITDNTGFFTISASNGEVLKVEMLGYQNGELTYAGKSPVTIVLQEDNQLLDDVVVVGYAVQKKINVTGAVSSISGDQLNARPVTSALQALQGADPSVNIQTASGNPTS